MQLPLPIRKRGVRAGLSLLFLFVGPLRLSAQTATVQGRITDPSGAIIAGAQVTATNTATGITSSSLTTGSGDFTIPFLPPGVYNLAAKKDGFSPTERRGVKLDVDQTARLDLTLQLGGVSQTVEVSASGPLLQTQTAGLDQQIENKTIVTLPLNGRDYTQLVTLGAGAAPNPHSRASNGFSLNGGTTLQTQIMLDGTDNTNREIGTDSHNINVLSPSIDAVQEFKVETANYSAQYGRSGGGLVTAMLKSGTNGIHGDAFEFLRNNDFDANNFFANRNHLPSPALRRNQFGGTVGGPIVRNRVFWFVSYQETRQQSQLTGATTVPTPAEIQGNFGNIAVYNPFGLANGIRPPFPNNVIPSSLFDSTGAKVAGLYPAPNLPGLINNYAYNQNELANAGELDSRFDAQLSQHDNAFVSFSRGTAENDQGSWFAPPGNGGGFGNLPINSPIGAYLVTIGETHIFSPAFVNDVHVAYTHLDSNQVVPATKPLFAEYGFQGIPQYAGLDGLPTLSLTGFSGLGDRTFAPNLKLVQEGQINDVVSWVKGKHTVTFGGEFIDTHNYANSWNLPRGSFNFTGQFTAQTPGKGAGSSLADLLLGQTAAASLGTFQVAALRNHYYGTFINDSWKIVPRLTLNLGLRYEIQTPWWERDNRMSNFFYSPGNPNDGTLIPAAPGSYLSRTFSNLDTNNFAPRVGLAFQANDKTVVRAAFGIFYGTLGYTGNNDSGTANPPYLYNIAINSATTAPLSNLILSTGFPAGTLNPAHVKNPNLYSTSGNYPMPLINQWNFAIQRQVPGDATLTIAYVGSSTSELPGLNDINAPPPGPGAINPRRPFPQYGEIEYETPYGHATYHALQVTYERRFNNGWSLLADYTWSKSLDNVLNHEDSVGGAFPQNPNNTNAEKAPSGFDVPQRFVASAIYKLPFDRPGNFIGRNPIGRAILGGWELGTIVTAQSGFFFTPLVSPNPANTTTPARPNRVCDGNLPTGQRTIDRWFNVSCFPSAAAFTFGNSARQVIAGPGTINLDALLDRTFNLTESKSLEFRAEFFNATNSVNFDGPDMTVTQPQAGTITSAQPARIIQLALRFMF